ncbi:hypothetical protein COU18_03305 [Candidatus Kaiserbacteria bacterium CG10_big_fil_rev_8_21_14_0_10_51_14]|uniref:Uncharacterized protein n=1 Tax=Candidatus Kaiserbacteria bacterium CG10_big_fil_rev_8_21_14_0_10_51_14 TaxID=1974610 RepID=A0A2H0UB95_9BACT|nr:MAG: hypothetical protein COU18_03305 [Candidatus Kaiserbacteria bacterium CG10_big_fil_rev_8_21_14_0_10_51_14]
MQIEKKKYTVMVDDNFHFTDESERYEAGSFDSAEEAINDCRRITEESVRGLYLKGITPAGLRDRYITFGEDPFVRSDEGTVYFSAWDYVTEDLCARIIADVKTKQP